MSEEDALYPELIRTLESLAEKFGFTLVDRVSKEAFILRRSPAQSNREDVQQVLNSAITHFGLIAKFEWTETNYERLTVFLFTPAEYERVSEENARLIERNLQELPSKQLGSHVRYSSVSSVIQGTIGATIGGRTRIYPNPDQEEVYVTIQGGRDEYIECDATELPEGIQLYFGFPVTVDKGKRVIIGPAEKG